MSYRGAVIDLDGTVYRGGDVLPGAPEAIDDLRERGFGLLFLSNNPTKTRAAYVERLAGMGIRATESEVLSAGTTTTRYLVDNHADGDLWVIGAPGLREQFAAAGLEETDDPEAADVLVASWDREFDYDTMRRALRVLDDGETAFLGSDPDITIPTGEGRKIPGSGAIINAVEGAVEREADVVLGKPSRQTIQMARDALDVPPAETILVGDRLDTDIAMGERAGMTTILVLSGVTDRADLAGASIQPDHVVESLAEVPDLLE